MCSRRTPWPTSARSASPPQTTRKSASPSPELLNPVQHEQLDAEGPGQLDVHVVEVRVLQGAGRVGNHALDGAVGDHPAVGLGLDEAVAQVRRRRHRALRHVADAQVGAAERPQATSRVARNGESSGAAAAGGPWYSSSSDRSIGTTRWASEVMRSGSGFGPNTTRSTDASPPPAS